MLNEPIVVGNIRYKAALPSPELRGVISEYWQVVLDDHSRATKANLDVLPKPGATLVIKVNRLSKEVHALLVGPHLRRFQTEINREESYWIVAIKPGAAYSWLNVPGTVIGDNVFSLDEINSTLSHGFTEIFSLNPGFNTFNEVLATWRPGTQLETQLQKAIDLLVDSKGVMSIQEVSSQVGMNMRQLQRKFKHVIGFTPKQFARILRLNAAVRNFRQTRANWTGIALDESYYDQSHLSREFRDLMAMKPSELA